MRGLADTGERRRAKAYNLAALANLLGTSVKAVGAGIWTERESSEKEISRRQEQKVWGKSPEKPMSVALGEAR
jgi:hypothetical protein